MEAIEGPIGTDLLRHICDLYGRDGDIRYANLEFAHRVFNCNPAGRSYHVFARHGEEVIGCCAVIPIKIMTPEGKLWAGKGEALYVRKQYRPTALFLIQRAVSFATERGLQLQFGLTHNWLEAMLQRLGFEALPSVSDYCFRMLRPDDLRPLTLSATHLVAARALKAAQAMVGTAATGLLRGLRVPIQVNRAEHLASLLTAMSFAFPPGKTEWSVATDEDSLRWRNTVGCLDLLSVDDGGNEFVAVTRGVRGASAEIVRWNVHQGGLARALYILQFVIDKANQEGAAAISIGSYADMSAKRTLQAAASLLGFVWRRVRRTVYVKAADSFFLDPRNLRLTWFFSI